MFRQGLAPQDVRPLRPAAPRMAAGSAPGPQALQREGHRGSASVGPGVVETWGARARGCKGGRYGVKMMRLMVDKFMVKLMVKLMVEFILELLVNDDGCFLMVHDG